jgi:methyl-accepting chemotaxis protein
MSKWVRWLEQWQASIFLKLLSGFVVVSLFMVFLTIFSLFTVFKLGDNINQVYDAQSEVSKATRLLDGVVSLQDSISRLKVDINTINRINEEIAAGLIKVSDPSSIISAYVVDYRGGRVALDDAYDNIKQYYQAIKMQSMGGTESRRLAWAVEKELPALLLEMDQIVTDSSNNRLAEARERWKNLDPRLSSVTVILSEFQKALEKNLSDVSDGSRNTVDDANYFREVAQGILIILCLLSFVVAVLLGLLFTYVFTRPVHKLKQRFQNLAGGDLATPLDVGNRDEYGDLGATFNESIKKLGDLVEQVQEQSVKISSAAVQITSASKVTAGASSEQAGEVTEATLIIEELNFTARDIAEAASLVAKAAEQALLSASEGQEAVKESIAGINQLKVRVQEIAEKILALNERAQRVGHIIEQITGIADQTHLLALNAAIESAAAGETGRRFAVVAAEVKKLAERSRAATREVQLVLSEIQFATAASVMATEQGMKQAEQGVLLAHRTGDANESIMQQIERTAQLSSAISLATQQQRSASEQVVSRMRQLASVIQEAAASARQSNALAADLDKVAAELHVVSSQFKVHPDDLIARDDYAGDEDLLLEYTHELTEPELAAADSGDAGVPVLSPRSAQSG